MESAPFEPSLREQQVAVSLLAHVARDDDEAVAASLAAVANEPEQLRPMGIIAALLVRFALGMDDNVSADLATWFSQEAQALAAAREQAA